MTGSLLRRLVLVEERAPRPPAPVELPDSGSFWERVRAVAPEPVWRYILEVDAELGAVIGNLPITRNDSDPDAWLKRHHPALDDVLEGLARATSIRNGNLAEIDNRLRYIQGWVIQWATARLGMVYATERPGAGVTTSTVIDRQVQERAAFDLLGWTIAESYRQWSDPCAFLEQWRSHFAGAGKFPYVGKFSDDESRANSPSEGRFSDRSELLGKAGLHDAELALLEFRGRNIPDSDADSVDQSDGIGRFLPDEGE